MYIPICIVLYTVYTVSTVVVAVDFHRLNIGKITTKVPKVYTNYLLRSDIFHQYHND